MITSMLNNRRKTRASSSKRISQTYSYNKRMDWSRRRKDKMVGVFLPHRSRRVFSIFKFFKLFPFSDFFEASSRKKYCKILDRYSIKHIGGGTKQYIFPSPKREPSAVGIFIICYSCTIWSRLERQCNTVNWGYSEGKRDW